MTPKMTIPQDSDLYAAIAAKVPGADAGRVRQVLDSYGVALASPLPARRELRVRRLTCEGEKTGTTDNDGPFTVDISFGDGPWVLASKVNSAGKSTLLWALSWALRGESVDEFRRPETAGWLRYVRADLQVGGVPVSVRLEFLRPGQPSATLLTADSVDQLLTLDGRDVDGAGVRAVATAAPPDVKGLVERLMLDRLGLRPISVWAAEPGAPKDEAGQRDSAEHFHSWASFYYAIALNAGHDKVLLGPTAFGQLPAKLLQIFLDVPYVPELTHLVSAQKRDDQEERRVKRRAEEDAEARRAQIQPLREALASAKSRWAELQSRQPDLTGLLTAADAAARKMAERQAIHLDLQQRFDAARRERLQDERAARRARQSAAARLLLGALNPEACPRCDHEIDEPRRAAEEADHRCAVCSNPLPAQEEDPDAHAVLLQRHAERELASRSAEAAAKKAAEDATARLGESRDRYEQLQAKLEAIRSDAAQQDLVAVQRECYQLEGALAMATGASAAVPAVVSSYLATHESQLDAQLDVESEILASAIAVLQENVRNHSKALFRDLNDKIVSMARSLGVTNLTSVDLDAAGRVNARKSGVKCAFKDFSPSERLRMRIATIIGMITVGHERGIMSHPGLLLIDAPTAEEVVPGDARVVLEALYEMANRVAGIQIVLTSTEEVLWEIFPADRIISGPGSRQLF
ncbi:hypothetical protein [Krasilnikovia sp. MM14-A1004]|uniref:hypothetical protein n=1 Tax=Krasilnikovia sp. MM14-A1004 TaxID=3373541 RepID=UPI00399C6821